MNFIWTFECMFVDLKRIVNGKRNSQWISVEIYSSACMLLILNLPLDWTFRIRINNSDKITQQFPARQCLCWLKFLLNFLKLFIASKPESIEMKSSSFFMPLIKISNHGMYKCQRFLFLFFRLLTDINSIESSFICSTMKTTKSFPIHLRIKS